MENFPKLMGMGDVSRCLGVTRQYVDHLIETGKLRCQKISTGKVFLESDVLVYRKDRDQKRKAKRR